MIAPLTPRRPRTAPAGLHLPLHRTAPASPRLATRRRPSARRVSDDESLWLVAGQVAAESAGGVATPDALYAASLAVGKPVAVVADVVARRRAELAPAPLSPRSLSPRHNRTPRHVGRPTVRRALNAVYLRHPALKALALKRRAGLPETEGHVEGALEDVFGLIDDGTGSALVEDVIAFGRRIGGSCAALLTRRTFRSFVDSEGRLTSQTFVAALNPHYHGGLEASPAAMVQAENTTSRGPPSAVLLSPANLTSLRRMFRAIDVDGDGLVSSDDVVAFTFGGCNVDAEVRARHARHIAAYDGDGDGRVSWEEFCAMHYAYVEQRHHHTAPPPTLFHNVRW